MIGVVRAVLIIFITLSVFLVWMFFSHSAGNDMTWALLPMIGLGGITLWAGWRSSRRIFSVLSGLWFLIWFVSLAIIRLNDGEILLAGHAPGTSIDISPAGFVVMGLGLIGSIILIRARQQDMSGLYWAPLNTTFSLAFLVLFVIGYGYLFARVTQGETGPLGVLILFMLPFVANLALMPWKKSDEK